MTTKFTIIIKYMNGETITFKEAADFKMMQQGLLFVEMPYVKAQEKLGKILRGVHTKSTRHWIPFAQIKNIEVLTSKTITNPQELKKYQKFLDHGIDMTVTEISHTEPPDPKEVAKKIIEEEKQEAKN